MWNSKDWGVETGAEGSFLGLSDPCSNMGEEWAFWVGKTADKKNLRQRSIWTLYGSRRGMEGKVVKKKI